MSRRASWAQGDTLSRRGGYSAAFWARLRAAADLRAAVALRAFSAELAAFFGLVMLPRLTAFGFFIVALGYHEIGVDNLALGS